jgi:Mitochondrial carrier protein
MAKGLVTDATGWSRKDVRTGFVAAGIAGFFMTCTVAPTDNLRTRLMNQPTNAKLYQGFSDCLVKTVQTDGVLRYVHTYRCGHLIDPA